MLNSDEDVLEKMAYTIANPTAAGLVRSPREWPGVVSLRLAERFSVDRPDVFAAKHTLGRVQTISDLLSFYRRYRCAWAAWRAGARDTMFPSGTYSLRIHARVAVHPPALRSCAPSSCAAGVVG